MTAWNLARASAYLPDWKSSLPWASRESMLSIIPSVAQPAKVTTSSRATRDVARARAGVAPERADRLMGVDGSARAAQDAGGLVQEPAGGDRTVRGQAVDRLRQDLSQQGGRGLGREPDAGREPLGHDVTQALGRERLREPVQALAATERLHRAADQPRVCLVGAERPVDRVEETHGVLLLTRSSGDHGSPARGCQGERGPALTTAGPPHTCGP